MPAPPRAVDVRFNTAQEIIVAIDRAKSRVVKLQAASRSLTARADKLLRKLDGVTPPESQGDEAVQARSELQSLRDRADQKWNKSINIETKYIARLKGKLAVMQTMILPGVDIPESIKQ